MLDNMSNEERENKRQAECRHVRKVQTEMWGEGHTMFPVETQIRERVCSRYMTGRGKVL